MRPSRLATEIIRVEGNVVPAENLGAAARHCLGMAIGLAAGAPRRRVRPARGGDSSSI